jgi:hypothetical protein
MVGSILNALAPNVANETIIEVHFADPDAPSSTCLCEINTQLENTRTLNSTKETSKNSEG